ncbi:hypothetical protein BV898_03420 [Hypsibius exemplaris]|uniref:Receptor ligand binding region domain-containing protein n=1 Tax=Hypsibius exemplaris TaxID=2072580 RepID=A0A1W0X510_HYPEX|nr:hypothetical protein BV898_03420 [Hypsibius exemplaris]
MWNLVVFAGFCQTFFVMARSSEDVPAYDIEIVTPTYCGTDSLMSLNYIGPSYTTGMQILRATSIRLNVTHRTLMKDNGMADCLTLLSNVQDVLARWYYAEKRKDSVPVILTPVVLHFGKASALRHLLERASKLDMTNEHYVFIAARPFPHSMFGTFSWQELQQDDKAIRTAYQSVILIQIIYLEETQQAKRTAETWRKLSNASNLTILRELPLVFLESTHNAFQMLEQVLCGLAKSGDLDPSSLQSGRGLAKHFFGEAFSLDLGNVTLNSAGVRRSTTAVQQMNNDSGQMETVIIAHERDDYSYDWEILKPENWYGNTHLPPNEPFCGFMGLKSVCDTRDIQRKTIVLSVCVVLSLLFGSVIAGTLVTRKILANQFSEWWLIKDDIQISAIYQLPM